MEKIEALREWCLERASDIVKTDRGNRGVSCEEIIQIAKQLEEYVTKKQED